MPLDPPFPAAWDPVPRTLVRGDHRPRRDRRGRRRHRLGRHDGRLRSLRAPLRRPGSAGDRASRPGPRDDRLPRRSVLAARGGPVGHRGQVAGLPVATLFGGAADGIPAYASCGMLLPAAERAESAAAPARGGLPALKIRIDPRRLEEGLAAVAATRHAVGDSMAIMVDLNQGWRMAGDTSPSLDPVGRARDRRAARRARRAVARGAAGRHRPARVWRRSARRRPGSGSRVAR